MTASVTVGMVFYAIGYDHLPTSLWGRYTLKRSVRHNGASISRPVRMARHLQ